MLYLHICFTGNIDVKVTHRTRSRRSIDLLGTPISYELDLNVEGADVKIHLTRNKHLVSNVPTLSLQHGLLTKLYLEDQEVCTLYFYHLKYILLMSLFKSLLRELKMYII